MATIKTFIQDHEDLRRMAARAESLGVIARACEDRRRDLAALDRSASRLEFVALAPGWWLRWGPRVEVR